jgi:UDP-N-acetylmuramoylalanine--D-glutamate ligase
MGGTDKGLNMEELMNEIPRYCKAVVFFKESGTEKFKSLIPKGLFDGVTLEEGDGLRECLGKALVCAQRGDIILFSPAFSSFGKWFKNEYDRGEQFLKLLNDLH